ncbi:MBL fold metallo-hydrolase [Hahella aquimaris]|uniref:MBL fold metallo-hydrolase n=1 Tax=Hahella sp. HNIBRBA332 TaxID=3015983 RepID=UPI00273AE3B5|nr:MBL fold metallo-hydrolase [Hahella sp. HNIBRBA332]WLQ17249.1 MBL fold metallo-hydrolase [Hahella sp. HNIBRBA332]
MYSIIFLFLAATLMIGEVEAAEVVKFKQDAYAISEAGITSLVLLSKDGVLITDPASPERAKALQAEIAKLTDRPVTHIVLSHEHLDHVGGTETFPGAEVICHISCKAVFDLDVRGMAPKKVHAVFDDRHSFQFGGRKVTLIHVGPADGFASTIIHLPEDGIVYSADLYADRYIIPGVWMDNDNYLGVLKALRMMQDLKPQIAVNAHSTSTSVQALEENVTFVEDLYQLVSTQITNTIATKGPGAVMDNIPRWSQELKLDQYNDWSNYVTEFPAHVRRMALSIYHGG